jgi:DNA repair photolyase
MLFNKNETIEEIAKKHSFETKKVKSILNKRKGSRQFYMEDYTINPYMGCSFDCSYCYINGSKYADNTNSYFIKENAVELFKTQLKNKASKGERAVILIGSASDPYMNIENETKITRQILQITNRFKFSVHLMTKSDLILRDIDILNKIKDSAILPEDIKENYNLNKNDENKLKTIISFSFTTTDNKIAKIFEKNAPTPEKRLIAIKKLKKEGFLVGVSLMPLLPYITDSEGELNKTMNDLKTVGVDYILPGELTLYGDENNINSSRGSYYNLLNKHFPDYLDKTKELFKENNYVTHRYNKKLIERIERIAKTYNLKTSII